MQTRAKLLALVLAVSVMLMAACDTKTIAPGPHWLRQPGRADTLVYVAVDPTVNVSGWSLAVDRAVARWNAGLAQLTLRRVNGACPTGANCISIKAGAVNAGSTNKGYDGAKHMYGNAARITVTTNRTDQATKDNIVCHEIGHAEGLAHDPAGGVGPCIGGYPAPNDLRLVDKVNGHGH
jgi:hypothetical protein